MRVPILSSYLARRRRLREEAAAAEALVVRRAAQAPPPRYRDAGSAPRTRHIPVSSAYPRNDERHDDAGLTTGLLLGAAVSADDGSRCSPSYDSGSSYSSSSSDSGSSSSDSGGGGGCD